MKRWAALLVILPALAACGAGEHFDLTRAYEGEDAVVRLRVQRTTIDVAGTLLVVLEADVGAGSTPRLPVTLGPPGAGQSLQIQDTGEEKPRALAGGRTRFRRWYRLEPFLSGDYLLPPFAVPIVNAKGAIAMVRTESVKIQVTSLLPADYERLEIRDIAPILRPPWKPPPGLVAALVILGAAAAGTGVWFWLQRRARERWVAPPRPAHLIAFEELEALVADDLPARGEIKLFYQRVTTILRKYVERRFGLRAPERTTEEFLGELRDKDYLTEDLKKLLSAFLRHADLVKFAQLRPPGDEIERTLSSCRDFVRATREPETEPAGAL